MSSKMAQLLHDVKAKQYFLIARAGLAVRTEDMSVEQLWEQMYIQFKGHLLKFSFSGHLVNLQKGIMFRKVKHLDEEKNIDPSDIHYGTTLWRKYLEIKRYIGSTISASWDQLMGPDGNIPSGKNLDDMLLETRRLCFDKDEEKKRKKSKRKGGYDIQKVDLNPNWHPLEWEIFLKYGSCSENPEKAFFFE